MQITCNHIDIPRRKVQRVSMERKLSYNFRVVHDTWNCSIKFDAIAS